MEIVSAFNPFIGATGVGFARTDDSTFTALDHNQESEKATVMVR